MEDETPYNGQDFDPNEYETDSDNEHQETVTDQTTEGSELEQREEMRETNVQARRKSIKLKKSKTISNAYTAKLKKITYADKLADICKKQNVDISIINTALDRIEKIKEGKIKAYDISEFDLKTQNTLTELARFPFKGKLANGVKTARYFISCIIDKERDKLKKVHKKRVNTDDNIGQPPSKVLVNKTLEQSTNNSPSNIDNTFTPHTGSITEQGSTQTEQYSNRKISNNNTMSQQNQIRNEIGTIIVAQGVNLQAILDPNDEITTRTRLHQELGNKNIFDFNHVSISKKGSVFELRIITKTKETTDLIISAQNTLFGGIKIVSAQSTANRLLMKCTINNNNRFKFDDRKEIDMLREHYGVIGLEIMPGNNSNTKTKKIKLEFSDSKSYFKAYINGIFLGNDRVTCVPNWKLLDFCIKCSEWEHSIDKCTSSKYTCFICGLEHNGLTCTTKEITCKNCTGDHESHNSICQSYKSKFESHNKYIYDLLKTQAQELNINSINIIIPRNMHIIYNIKNAQNPNNAKYDNKELGSINNRLNLLEDFEKNQNRRNDELKKEIDTISNTQKEMRVENEKFNAQVMESNLKTQTMLTDILNMNKDYKTTIDEDRSVRNLILSRLNGENDTNGHVGQKQMEYNYSTTSNISHNNRPINNNTNNNNVIHTSTPIMNHHHQQPQHQHQNLPKQGS